MAVPTTLVPVAQAKQVEPHGTAGYDDAELLAVLEVATAEFRRDTRQTISAVDDDVEVHDPYGSPVILLRQFPIRSVSAIVVDGKSITPTAGLWTADGIVRRDLTCRTRFPLAGQSVSVTYSHGFPEIPLDIVDAIIERALNRAEALFGQVPVQITAGPFTTITGQSGQQSFSGAVGMTAKWAAAVERYKVER